MNGDDGREEWVVVEEGDRRNIGRCQNLVQTLFRPNRSNDRIDVCKACERAEETNDLDDVHMTGNVFMFAASLFSSVTEHVGTTCSVLRCTRTHLEEH